MLHLLVGLHIHVLGPVLSASSSDPQMVHEKMLHGASKLCLGAVVVRFEEEQDGADLEERRAYQGSDAAGEF